MIKKTIFAILIVLLFGGTAIAYSYWDNFEQQSEETLNFGEGVTLELEVIASAPDGKQLVPEGEALTVNHVEEIVLTYNVNLDQETIDDLGLQVTSSNVLIGGDSTYNNLINIDIQQASDTVNSSTVLVTVTVTVNAPATYEIYQQINNQEITFTLTFEAIH